MSTFHLLFSVKVMHQFFDGRECKSVRLEPTEVTATFSQKIGLLFRSLPSGIAVYCEDRDFQKLTAFAAQKLGLRLAFKLISDDMYFDLFTKKFEQEESAVRYFDSRRAHDDAKGVQRLHSDETASERDYKSVNRKLIRAVLSQNEIRQKPRGLIQFVLNNSENGLCALDSSNNLKSIQRDYIVRFNTRETLWKYYLLGDFARRDVYIKDVTEGVTDRINFIEKSRETVGGLTAKLFVSDAMMPMRELFEKRFQLKEKSGLSEKILIKRMPNASVKRVSKEIVDAEEVTNSGTKSEKEILVSEIYINQ